MTDSSEIKVRWMIRRDLPSVLNIEEKSFEFPWTKENFIHCMRQRNSIHMVAEQNDEVVGFMAYELHKNRLHLINFAVDPEHRRQGIGTAMIEKLVSKLSPERRKQVSLEVREGNLPAQLFFKSFGFKAKHVIHDFYDDTTEDAYLMEYNAQSNADKIRYIAGTLEASTKCPWELGNYFGAVLSNHKEFHAQDAYSDSMLTDAQVALKSGLAFEHPEAAIEKLSRIFEIPAEYFEVTGIDKRDGSGYIVLRLEHLISIHSKVEKQMNSADLKHESLSDFKTVPPKPTCIESNISANANGDKIEPDYRWGGY